MPPLTRELRQVLDRTVVDARHAGESAAKVALSALAVDRDKPFDDLSEHDRALRRALRVKERQLGSYEALVSEIGYQHWHRMLFARFLGENSLLMHPEAGVPVSLEEVADLAREQGELDPWVLAARYAAKMLPAIFREGDPELAIRFAPEGRKRLDDLLASLPSAVFTSDDGLGWVYQFWQSERKVEANKRGKIESADLAPVTQLFTEPYIVHFLLDNTLGAWWAGRHPDSAIVRSCVYLRVSDDGSPVAGTYDGWPARPADVTVMDPCCGSGHFLVAAADMLRMMRMEDESLNPAEAAAAVIRDNLFGLELDARCLQLAAFNLALDAWKAGGYQVLPIPNVACSGIAIKGQRADWHRLAGSDASMRSALDRLYDLFQDATDLGSLIDPRSAASDGLWSVEVDRLLLQLDRALQREKDSDPAAAVFGATAAGSAKAARLLAGSYSLVATNPPFLGQRKMPQVLQRHVRKQWPAASQDLATTMLARWRRGVRSEGSWAWVLPQNWLYLPRSADFRQELFAEAELDMLAQLGEGAFRSSAAAGAFICLVLATERPPARSSFAYYASVETRTPEEKEIALRSGLPVWVEQLDAQSAPGYRLVITKSARGKILSYYAITPQGIKTGDDDRFRRKFWEIQTGVRWRFMQSTVLDTTAYGGRQHVVDWTDGGRAMIRPRIDSPALGRSGVAVSLMRDLPVTLYTGEAFDSNLAPIVPAKPQLLPALWAFASSSDFRVAARGLEQGVKVNTGTLGDIPFDIDHWERMATEQYPDGLPGPYSNDPTQWLFKGDPSDSTDPLQVAVARLLGFRWPDQTPDALDELVDADGVVSIPGVTGELPASQRVRAMLGRAWGDAWSPARLTVLLAKASVPNKDLETWLRDSFFASHAKLFHNRPFIWQIWDGRRDGFSVLVNYRQLNLQLLDRITHALLGSWIELQRDEVRKRFPGSEARLVAAQDLQRKLELIAEGEPPYDIYIRWKPLQKQPIGWDPDLNDGVRLNIRPFVIARVLRSKFTIDWKKDRGKDPDGSERANDRHFTRDQKLAARAKARRD